MAKAPIVASTISVNSLNMSPLAISSPASFSMGSPTGRYASTNTAQGHAGSGLATMPTMSSRAATAMGSSARHMGASFSSWWWWQPQPQPPSLSWQWPCSWWCLLHIMLCVFSWNYTAKVRPTGCNPVAKAGWGSVPGVHSCVSVTRPFARPIPPSEHFLCAVMHQPRQ